MNQLKLPQENAKNTKWIRSFATFAPFRGNVAPALHRNEIDPHNSLDAGESNLKSNRPNGRSVGESLITVRRQSQISERQAIQQLIHGYLRRHFVNDAHPGLST